MSISPITSAPDPSFPTSYQTSHPASSHEATSTSTDRLSAPPKVTPPRSPAPSHDTVRISRQAQAQQLLQQGETPSEIARNLGLSLPLVESDLGLSSASASASAPALTAASVKI